MLDHGNLVGELQCPVSHCYTNAAAQQTQEPHCQSKIQTPILQSMQFKGSLGHGSSQPGRGRLSMGAGAEWVMMHSLNLRPRGGKVVKKRKALKKFFFVLHFLPFYDHRGDQPSETPGVWLGDWGWEERDGPRQPRKISSAQLPARPSRKR